MKKEKLTLNDIKADLHFGIKYAYHQLAFFLALFICGIIVFIVAPKSDAAFDKYKLAFGLLLLALFLTVVFQIYHLIILHKNVNTNCIVKDKLIRTETPSKYAGKRLVSTYVLYFSQYGRYVIPAENYRWSSSFSMSDKSVYNYANCGDEYYLVLSKPHTGRILLAYNTKMFSME